MKQGPNKRRYGPRRDHQRPRFSRRLAVVYEDDSLVVVNKPPGLLAVPIPRSSTPSALSLLAAELKEQRQRAFIVHRIDRFASGALLFAKTRPDREALVAQFLNHVPLRGYLVIVRGHLTSSTGRLVHYFRKQGMFQKLTTATDPKGARAELCYSVERPLRGASLLNVELVTGLQNQIRVQLAAIGHPVIGDRKYSPEEAAESRIARVALHAERLEFTHPRSGKRIAVDCEPPTDFRSLVQLLSLPPKAQR